MNSWLDPVRRAIDDRSSPVTIFFRDDDVGWANDKLYRLLDIFAYCRVPLALAVIPAAVDAPLASELRTLLSDRPATISIHQHGFAHLNHEPNGRKCEFGPSRARHAQRRDIAGGRRLLEDRLGGRPEPIFTPPWNRCTRDTAECLIELGFALLSRDAAAECFELAGLAEWPVHLDWSGRHGVAAGPAAWGQTIARALQSADVVGVMLHHAAMTADDRRMLGDLIGQVVDHERVTVRQMSDAANVARIAQGPERCI